MGQGKYIELSLVAKWDCSTYSILLEINDAPWSEMGQCSFMGSSNHKQF